MILEGDCIEVMSKLEPESVQCCVTSPPYWGLRDYGVDGQLGSEATPELFVAKLVEVFRAVKRVLRDDGTLWMNLGDSYANVSSGGGGAVDVRTDGRNTTPGDKVRGRKAGACTMADGLKPKDLCGMPWRVAFALQADGWYLRSDIIWHKPNPMPESCTDRPTKSHEYIFLMTKKPRYYYDAEAVREKGAEASAARYAYSFGGNKNEQLKAAGNNHLIGNREDTGSRNARSVWTIPTQPFSKAHFATYPEKLVERCLKAGTSSKGCCPECGTPWVRVVETSSEYIEWAKTQRYMGDDTQHKRGKGTNSKTVPEKQRTVGWKPGCECGRQCSTACNCGEFHKHQPEPCTVLDPFSGSGATGVVAKQLGLDYIGIELNPEYAEMSRQRIANPYPQPEIKDVVGQMELDIETSAPAKGK